MIEPPDYYDELERRGGHFRERGFDYDKLAVAYSQKGFETLTYLNGGALVALPAVLAFFKADIPKASIILTGVAFIIGLLLVVLSQLMAFFTMAKRGEMHEMRYFEQAHRVAALTDSKRQADADKHFATSERKRSTSNYIRIAGLICFVGSLIAFIAGCGIGAVTVVIAKEKFEVLTPR